MLKTKERLENQTAKTLIQAMRILFISLFFICLTACSKEGNLAEHFGINFSDFSDKTVIVDRLAISVSCTKNEFENIKLNLSKNGFKDWNTYHGILGAGSKRIIEHTKYPLHYSFKNGGEGYQGELYKPVVVFDEEKSLLYFVLSTDFGG